MKARAIRRASKFARVEVTENHTRYQAVFRPGHHRFLRFQLRDAAYLLKERALDRAAIAKASR